ncbi:MAG: hypothetical protein ABI876_03375, partial [Bacteroidota bacterium]
AIGDRPVDLHLRGLRALGAEITLTEGDIIALMPELPSDEYGRECESFMHLGQHSGADYEHVISQTKACNPWASDADSQIRAIISACGERPVNGRRP